MRTHSCSHKDSRASLDMVCEKGCTELFAVYVYESHFGLVGSVTYPLPCRLESHVILSWSALSSTYPLPCRLESHVILSWSALLSTYLLPCRFESHVIISWSPLLSTYLLPCRLESHVIMFSYARNVRAAEGTTFKMFGTIPL